MAATPAKTPLREIQPQTSDRFIPSRKSLVKSQSRLALDSSQKSAVETKPTVNNSVATPGRERYQRQLSTSLLDECQLADPSASGATTRRILSFGNNGENDETTSGLMKSPWALGSGYDDSLSGNHHRSSTLRHLKVEEKHAELVLDAPEMPDNFYLNLLDWSRRSVIAIGLGPTVHLWNCDTGDVQELLRAESDVMSVKWSHNGALLAVGFEDPNSGMELWDLEGGRKARTLGGHTDRVATFSWGGAHQLASGSRDTSILIHDVRINRHVVSRLSAAHADEVCAVRFAPPGSSLSAATAATTLASGGNDNAVALWDLRRAASSAANAFAAAGSGSSAQPSAVGGGREACLYRFAQHNAAVKAMTWSPHQRHMLATGGGSTDKSIKLWNTQSGAMLSSTHAGSQVTGLAWGPTQRELVSSHGFSDNAVCVWATPAMVRIGQLTGHRGRILHLAEAPDRMTVATAAADETLRIWRLFTPPAQRTRGSSALRGGEDGEGFWGRAGGEVSGGGGAIRGIGGIR
eukprot:TRINITY_DN30056_c0_g2_i1.p1 TRINITY_DN30056_c0_g2~~TRINITY_DN30056_c0_g2_i1.p1  ORF type:complete len:520 (-),score=-24.99 TRINITY_DN30056_c0_g2_i1:831-2390(-)